MPAAAASFEPEPASVGAARRYAVGRLQASAVVHLQDDVRTVVSELATNAVLHARTPFTMTVLADDAGVRIAVTDSSPTRPRLPRHGDLSSSTGRGLRIVAQLCAAWGVDVHADGKTTWCLVAASAPSGPTGEPRDPGASTPAARGERRAEGERSQSDDRAGGTTPAACLTGPDQEPEQAVAA